MAFTDNCDLYAAVHEEGVNRVIGHIMRQRPSLFNYATDDVARNRELWCVPIEFTNDVTKYGNSLFSIQSPLPVIGADSPPVNLSFCAQVTKIELDFHPSNTISLPADLPSVAPAQSLLQEQQFALHFQVCGALGCASEREIDAIPDVKPPEKEGNQSIPPVHIRGELNCFCLEVFVIGHCERILIQSEERLIGKVDDIEIVDIQPSGLEENIECYVKTAVRLILRQKLTIPLSTFFISFPLFDLATITLSPTPAPPVPHNPAIAEDQLKAFITMTTI